jgi:hypothetical protein
MWRVWTTGTKTTDVERDTVNKGTHAEHNTELKPLMFLVGLRQFRFQHFELEIKMCF